MATPVDIAASLTMDEIPVKLRCAACNQLANNAFRMPCCDQSICEDCQSSLPQACPVCLHEPVKADDCRPNKALRTTIKVFLRKKGIEREAARKKEALEKVAATPAIPASPQAETTPVLPEAEASATSSAGNTEGMTDGNKVSHVSASVFQDANISSVDQMDIPRPSIESGSGDVPNGIVQNSISDVKGGQEKTSVDQQNTQQPLAGHEQWGANNVPGTVMSNGSFGFDGSTNGGFPNMGFNGAGDFSQMMQFMPNGMQASSLGALPNIMGMPGMGMDPMILSQGMYGGFGGQGMGMNSMNVGMGFNAGQSAFGGFNGQPAAWNAGQDKFNQNAYGATGMGGDFGAAAGYGGYNMPQHQGNFNQMHHHQYQNNDFQSGYNGPGFHNRGRGRGRGYQNTSRGRGGFHQVTPSNQANYEPFHHQIPQQLAQQDSSLRPPSSEAQNGQEQPKQAADVSHLASDAKTNMGHAEDEQLAKELEPGDADDAADDNGTVPPINPSNGEDDASTPIEPLKAIMKENEELESDKNLLLEKENKPAPIETFVSSDTKEPEVSQVSDSMMAPSVMMPPPAPAIPLGPAALYSADHLQDFGLRGRGGGRGFYKGSSDYRGGLRGRSASINPNTAVVPSSSVPTVPAADIALTVPIEPKGLGVEGAPKAPKALREGLPNTGMRGGRGFSIIGRASSATQGRPNGRARSRSPSPARSRSPLHHHHRTHRHRSKSSSKDSDHEKRRERHRRHARHHEVIDNGKPQDSKDAHSRERSVESSSRRSSHRSHRDHEKEKEAGRGSHRSHRSQRERSRDRDGESRSIRRRSRSVGGDMNRTKRSEGNEPSSPTDSRRKDKHDDSSHSSRKRRDRDDDERYRERKRSKQGFSDEIDNKENASHIKHAPRDEADKSSSVDLNSKTQERSDEISKNAPKKAETDHHTLEREARNRERLLKELQRREAMEGKGSTGTKRDSKVEGRAGPTARRVSYKYEDEESSEARATRVESEREAGRWR